jgi:hypothetical protein
MSVRVGFGVGPFYISGGGSRRRRRYHGKHKRFHLVSYWLFGIWALEVYFWMLIGYWWLMWATVVAILHEVSKYRELPAWWGPIMDQTRPPWPKRKPTPVQAGWRPKPIR